MSTVVECTRLLVRMLKLRKWNRYHSLGLSISQGLKSPTL